MAIRTTFATLFSCSAIGVSNPSSWCDQDFEKAIQDAKTVSDPAERAKPSPREGSFGFRPGVPLAHSQVYTVARKERVRLP